MKSHKYRTRYLLIGCLVVVGLLAVIASCVAGREREPAGSQERLRALLVERHDILKRGVANLQEFVESGRADICELSTAVTAMHWAEADLCRTDAARIKVYEKLVDTLKTHEGLAVRQADAGRISNWQLDKARVVTLDAQIDLERLRLGQRSPMK